jgi:dTDP-4-dehydrorhamnose 3,5-epimerase
MGRYAIGTRGANMQVTAGSIHGLLVFTPTPHRDERGFFSRTFDAEIAQAHGLDPHGFSQDSVSRSARGVIRGLHLRSGKGEAKVVRCSYGAVFDVVLDLRPDSPTFLRWESFELRDDTCRSIYIPAGCAHGFQALTGPADVAYRIDRPHDPAEDVAIAFDDPQLGIPWPLPPTLLSERDHAALPVSTVVGNRVGQHSSRRS